MRLDQYSAEVAAMYERNGFRRFVCKICGAEGFAEFSYETMGACGPCVKALAHEFVMKHDGEPDQRFAPKSEYAAYLAERAARKAKDKKPIPHAVRRQVLERDQYRCQICGDHRNLQVDHKHPEAKGGTLHLDNLQCLCKGCNVKKGDRL